MPREGLIVKHTGTVFKTEKWRLMEEKGQHDKVIKEMLKSANTDGGPEAVESE